MKCKRCDKPIADHTAGRELDACVAKVVFNVKQIYVFNNEVTPKYSERIADAYQMEERIAELGLIDDYIIILCASVYDKYLIESIHDKSGLWHLTHATPEERCKAALMTASYIE